MDTAADWAALSPYAPGPHENAPTNNSLSVSNLSWSQRQQAMSQAPVFGGRRLWLDYSFELTGYGAVELCGPLAYRVTIAHPDDSQALRQLHRLVRSGRLRPAFFRRQLDSRVHVIDRAVLSRTRVDARGSWLCAAQRVARLCGADDEVAQMAGPALRQILWCGREHMDSDYFTATIAELRRAAEELAAERARYVATLECKVLGFSPDDVESIRLEIQALAQVRREWEGTPRPGAIARRRMV